MKNIVPGGRRAPASATADACWDVKGILARARRLKVKPVGCIATHYHFDHTGGVPPGQFRGMIFGLFGGGADARVPGLHEMAADGAAAHAHASEVARVAAQCQLAEGEIVPGQLHWGARHRGAAHAALGRLGLPLRPRERRAARRGGGAEHERHHAAALLVGDTISRVVRRFDLPDSDTSAMFDSLKCCASSRRLVGVPRAFVRG